MDDDPVAGREVALRQGRWAEARDAFAAALAHGESAAALAGMGTALWWLDEAQASARYHERAYAVFQQAGDGSAAAMVAISLSITQIANLGNYPAAQGWLGLAERAAGDPPDGAVQRWLVLMRGFLNPDHDQSCLLLREAAQLGREAEDTDVELVALADLGERLVVAGQVEEGLALIDEAMAGACARECAVPAQGNAASMGSGREGRNQHGDLRREDVGRDASMGSGREAGINDQDPGRVIGSSPQWGPAAKAGIRACAKTGP